MPLENLNEFGDKWLVTSTHVVIKISWKEFESKILELRKITYVPYRAIRKKCIYAHVPATICLSVVELLNVSVHSSQEIINKLTFINIYHRVCRKTDKPFV